ncbi:MAG TPA: hypothetical protein VK157_04320 [Phycisphaerales bacterium]|nr:hypothetical protein [Phycisphaerales bacterium]
MHEAATSTTEVRARGVWACVVVAAVMVITGIVLGQLPHDEFGIPSGTAAGVCNLVCGAVLTLILANSWWRPSHGLPTRTLPTRIGILIGAAAASLGLTILVTVGVWVVRLVVVG